jgi:hypothetical protein
MSSKRRRPNRRRSPGPQATSTSSTDESTAPDDPSGADPVDDSSSPTKPEVTSDSAEDTSSSGSAPAGRSPKPAAKKAAARTTAARSKPAGRRPAKRAAAVTPAKAGSTAASAGVEPSESVKVIGASDPTSAATDTGAAQQVDSPVPAADDVTKTEDREAEQPAELASTNGDSPAASDEAAAVELAPTGSSDPAGQGDPASESADSAKPADAEGDAPGEAPVVPAAEAKPNEDVTATAEVERDEAATADGEAKPDVTTEAEGGDEADSANGDVPGERPIADDADAEAEAKATEPAEPKDSAAGEVKATEPTESAEPKDNAEGEVKATEPAKPKGSGGAKTAGGAAAPEKAEPAAAKAGRARKKAPAPKRKPLPAVALLAANDETLVMSAESLAKQVAKDKQLQSQAKRQRQRGIKAALATLPVPEAGPSFWVDLETALADQQHLAIAARPAIRPITEPPPLSQPKLSDYIDATHARPDEAVRVSSATKDDRARHPGKSSSDFGLGGGGRNRGRTLGVVAVLVVLGLLVIGTIMGDTEDEPPTSTGNDDAPTTTAAANDTTPTTVPVVPGLETDAHLTSAGIGPLQVGRTLAQITEAGVTVNVDQPTFDASGGTCFDARPAGVADLTLRVRSPEPGAPITDAAAGVLGAVSISNVDGSLRSTDAEVGLGATEEVVLDAHAGALEVSDNPSRPGGRVYLVRSPDNPNLGIAYATDGRVVTDISVGETTLIGPTQTCA